MPEYWLIDPKREQVELYRLTEAGQYRLAQPEDDAYRSEVVPGFWLKAAWLWQEPLPKVLELARRWALV